MESPRLSQPLHYERKLVLSFGAVVLLLILLATWAATFLFQRSQAMEEDRLCGTITAIVSESISRVSFSGKHHARQLVQEMLSRAPELVYISVETPQGDVLAHSDPSRNDSPVDEGALALTRRSLEANGPVLTERTWAGTVVKEAVAPYRGGYDNQVVGVVRVGVRVDVTRNEQFVNLLKLLVLVAGLTLAAIVVVYLLSRLFGGTASRLARQLRGILDNTPLPIAISDRSGRLIASSVAFDTLVQTVGSERSTMSLLQSVLPESARELLWQTDAQEHGAALRIDRELQFQQEDGDHYWHYTRFPIFLNASGEELQSCILIRDITESRRAEGHIVEILQRLRTITATVPVVLYEIVDAEEDPFANRFTFVSEKVHDLLGVSAEAMVADPSVFSSLVHPDDREALGAASRAAVLEGGTFLHDFRAVLADGEVKWVRASSMPSGVEGGLHTWSGYLMDITASKQGELALAESERQYRNIFENTPVGIFRTTFAGRFVEANPTLAAMLGYATPTALIHAVADVGADLYYDSVFKNRLREALLESPGGARVAVEFKRLDGSRFHAIINASLQFDAEGHPAFLNGTIEDINERKHAEELLRQSEEKFSRLFLLSPDSITLSDFETGEYLDVNETFVRETGYTREEALGRSAKSLGLYADDRVRQGLADTLKRQGRIENFEFEARYKNGALAICSVSSQVVEIGQKRSLLAIVRDITNAKRMQEMMIQTEKMISVGGIAAGIAHEINNPLGIVLQAGQNLVQRTRLDFAKNIETAREIGLDMELLRQYFKARKLDTFIEDIVSGAVRASAIIRHMLDFSRRSESRRKVCDIPGIIDKAVDLASSDYDLKKDYDFKRIKIERDYADDLPSINCTETELEQVVLNLLRNAAQALATSEPPVQNPTIGIRALPHGDFLRIELSDNGPGMPPEVQRRVFEPFYTTKPPGVGTGLGLSVSYFIITKGHGGTMSVNSHPGVGTVFVIELPLGSVSET